MPISNQDLAREYKRDIETARRFYGDLLAFEDRMEAAEESMHNRGHWIEAIVALRKARASIELFIGDRMTADVRWEREAARKAQEVERRASLTDEERAAEDASYAEYGR